jgi:hypothetical protein
MKLIQISLLLCVVGLATGCPKTRTTMPSAIGDKLIQKEADQLVTLANNYDTAIASGTAADLGKAQLYRNELMHVGILLIDDNYNQFENDLFVKRATTNVAGDLTELGVAAATGITNGERVKTILAIALTAFKGGRKSIDVNFFRERSTEIIALKMRASRARILQTIYQGLAVPVDKYPLGAGLDDLINYLNAGSLNSALLELAQDTGQDARNARASAAEFKIHSFLTEAQVVTLRTISDAREDLRGKLFSTDKATADNATARIRIILARLYTPAEIAAATTSADLFKMLQDKVAEATRNRDNDSLNRIQAALNAP